MTASDDQTTESHEFQAFLFLTVLLAPLISIMIVGGYGLATWIYQLISGPPGAS